MGTSDNGQEVLRQNLEEKGTFQALYQMHLLFREKGKRPEGKKILGRLQKEFGQVDLVADVDHSLATFAIADFPRRWCDDRLRSVDCQSKELSSWCGGTVWYFRRIYPCSFVGLQWW